MKFPDWLQVYGDITYRNKKCPRESAEQISFFSWIRRTYPISYGLMAIHPRNEAKRTHGQAWREKAEGLSAGASDIIIPGAPAFVCELKRQDHTICKWEDGQLEYLEACLDSGAFVCVALGYAAARESFMDYIAYKNI